MQPLLRVENLTIEFDSATGPQRALEDLSFQVNAGEVLAIVGESGSGKSITSLSILQLLPQPPTRYPSGKIWFAPGMQQPTDLLQLPLQKLSSLRGSQLAMIFQEPMNSLNPVHTCGQQVTEAIRLHRRLSAKKAREEAIAWFRKVKLPEPEQVYSKYPHQLSGGQKQRVMIAMAMCCEPALLICDEPTTALDVTVQKTILQLLRELQQQTGMGIIFITHDLGVVSEIADRCLVLYQGKKVEESTVKTLFQNPQHPYTKGLLACRPVLHPKGKRLPVVADFLKTTEQVSQPLPATTPEPLPPIVETTPLLKVKNLCVDFVTARNWWGRPTKKFRAVDNISFELMPGETLGLVGESGCGKTTLGRTLLRLIEPSAGEIFYQGRHLLDVKGRALRRMRQSMQLVFQDPYSSLNPRMPVGEAILEPMRVHGIYTANRQREKAVHLLEKVGLSSHHFNRYPHEFSGGQRQRIVIARALALNPGFIVCDESVSALDVSVQAQVLNLLNDLKSEFGFTTIFISHDLSVVRYISDRILVMNRGHMEECGLADDIYFRPKSAYTQQLLSSIPGGPVSGRTGPGD